MGVVAVIYFFGGHVGRYATLDGLNTLAHIYVPARTSDVTYFIYDGEI